jgi:hypothetical protein
LIEHAKDEGWLVSWPEKVNIGRGTAVSTGSCACYVFDYSAMEGAVEKTSGESTAEVTTLGVISSH